MVITAAKTSISPDHITASYSLPTAPIPVAPNVTGTSPRVLRTTDQHSQSKLTHTGLAQWPKPLLSYSPRNSLYFLSLPLMIRESL